MIRTLRALAFGAVVAMASGCISQQGQWGEEVSWPGLTEIGQAAKSAATDPHTWVPVVAAGVLVVTDRDDRWSEDLADEQPFFGSDAEDASDDLRDAATAIYAITALAAPSPSLGDKLKGLSVGVSTMVLDGLVNRGLKDSISRERPDGTNDNSMPSGHTSKAASRTNMALRNLRDIEMPDWARQVSYLSLQGVAVSTGLARVEAGRHHLSDVLIGYATGQFIANFMHEAFNMEESGLEIAFSPAPGGGALTLKIPLD